MKTLLCTFLIFTSMIASSAAAEEAVAAAVASEVVPNTTYLMCKNKNVVRTVRVLKKEGGGCQTAYTKEGVDQVVSESQWSKGCEKVLNNIRVNLEKASWKCKDISDARISFSID